MSRCSRCMGAQPGDCDHGRGSTTMCSLPAADRSHALNALDYEVSGPGFCRRLRPGSHPPEHHPYPLPSSPPPHGATSDLLPVAPPTCRCPPPGPHVLKPSRPAIGARGPRHRGALHCQVDQRGTRQARTVAAASGRAAPSRAGGGVRGILQAGAAQRRLGRAQVHCYQCFIPHVPTDPCNARQGRLSYMSRPCKPAVPASAAALPCWQNPLAPLASSCRIRDFIVVQIVNRISMATALAQAAPLSTSRAAQRAAQAFKPPTARIARPAHRTTRINRCKRGSLQVVAVRVENEEVALGTVAPDFEVKRS